MLPIIKKCLTPGGLFRTLRKDFRQIYWKCCDQWRQKNCVFENSGKLDWATVLVPGIHTNTSDCFCIDYNFCAHAMLIEDLLNEGYKYVITARLQSDPVEDVFPSTGEWMAVGFLSICEKSKTPRGFCNTVLYLKKILTFGKRILHLKIWSALL